MSTGGDRDKTTPLSVIGGKGIFTKEVQVAVLEGRADLAVHSGKDLPAITPDGLLVAAVMERAEPTDCMIGAPLDGIPSGGTIATGSIRRRAQLAALRPDVVFAELRGNMARRFAAAHDDGIDAVVAATAAVVRLGLDHLIAERLDPSAVVPQVAQGHVAVECLTADAELVAMLAAIEHEPSRRTFDAERAFLHELGGDCELPAGAHATHTDAGLVLEAIVGAVDGSTILRATRSGPTREGPDMGRSLARELLDDAGGSALLGRDVP